MVDKAGTILLQICSRLLKLVLLQVNGFQIQSSKFNEPSGFFCTMVSIQTYFAQKLNFKR